MRWLKCHRSILPIREGSRLAAPKRGLVVRSAESSRMTGMRHVPVNKRAALIKAFLRSAR